MSEYQPYGPEWEAEMMKLPKKQVISMFRQKCFDNDASHQIALIERTDCPACGGLGNAPDCYYCDGTGTIERVIPGNRA